MKTTIEFLDACKASNGGASDYAIAKVLGVRQQTVSNWRVGKDFMGDSTAIRVAHLLKIDPAYVIACAHAERSKKDEERAVWQDIMHRLGGAAAALALGLGLSGAPAPAQASPVNLQHQDSNNLYYVKSRRNRKVAKTNPFSIFGQLLAFS